MAALIALLAIIGWGAGLGAALVCKSVRGVSAGRGLRVRVASMVVALLVATSCSYAYAVVLASVGVVACDTLVPLPATC